MDRPEPRLQRWNQDHRRQRQENLRAQREAELAERRRQREEERAQQREERRAIREEKWRQYEIATTLCLNCYGLGHRRPCRRPGIIACSHCFKLNIFTNSCSCRREKNDKPIHHFGSVFRLAGEPQRPLFYIDIMIIFKMFQAKISTGQAESTINYHLSSWIESLAKLVNDDVEHDPDYVDVPITRRHDKITLRCKVVRYQTEEIILGTDYLMQKGFSMTVDGISLNQNSISLTHPREIQYFYNLPQGAELKRFVRAHGGKIRNPRIFDIPDWPITKEDEIDNQLNDDYLEIGPNIGEEDLENI